MHENTILAIIDRANDLPNADITIRTRKRLSPLVEVAQVRVWHHQITMSGPERIKQEATMYLISTTDQHCVGAIQDGEGYDLHWVVAPAYRGQGLLRHALYTTILPHLLKCWGRQRVTISRGVAGEYFEASQQVARNVGFRQVSATPDEIEYEVTKQEYMAQLKTV